MPPKRKDEELDLDVHPSLEKEYLDRIERAKQTCVGSVNGKQREAFIVRGIDKDITDKSRAIREKEKLTKKAPRKAKRLKTEPPQAGQQAVVKAERAPAWRVLCDERPLQTFNDMQSAQEAI